MAKEQIVALCADDYGLSYGVSAGILEALDAGRVTAVSALVNGPRWPAMGLELVRRGRDADIGLHFNLTLGRPLSSMPKFAPNGEFPPLSQVVKMAYGRRLPMDEIRGEIDRQFDRFEAIMDRPPDHVDGHQHIHVLPGIRSALLDAMAARRLGGRVWVRDAGDGVHRILARGANARKAFSALSLASGFRREARRRGFDVNDGFAGFSDFHPSFDYARIFQSYLRAPGRRHLIMCHPGHVDEDLRELDPVTITREQELAFLLSPKLPEMLERRGLRLARLSQADRRPSAA
ncbi:MAG: ChbG/HpnK family deacetylase [Alphaproteobacteria bacterium]|nr:ChbG/HpnK family deacetylase [Alphaproteobacteria bacterium]MBM3623851.1 ChbG/HpnK family deacetylase [Alphaproteobacteria bacterium]